MKPPRPVSGWSVPKPKKDRPDPSHELEREESLAEDADDAEFDDDGDDGDDRNEAAGHHHEHRQPPVDRTPAPPQRERLQRVLARAGIGSRRACEQLIEDGEVQVNGTVVDRLPVFVDLATDRITVRDRNLRFREDHVYVMLFKPRGVLSTNEIDPERRRAIDLVPHPSKARLFPVGRLDVDSSGLLLLTSDGELANRLTHPRYGVHKTYEVTVDGRLEPGDLARLERGVFLQDRHSTHGRKAGRRTSRSELTIIKASRDRTRLRMELREGRNRQIRRMMLYVGHKVRKLRRVSLGPLKLRGLRTGEWRDLTHAEIKALRRAADIGEKAWKKEQARSGKSADAKKGRSATPRSSRRSGSSASRRPASRPGGPDARG